MRSEHGAATRAWGNGHDRIDLGTDLLKGQSRDYLFAFERQVAAVVEMLEGTAAAFTIMRTPLDMTIRTGGDDIDQSGAIASKLRRHRLTRQSEGDENLTSIVLGHAVALRSQALDVQSDGLSGHRAHQAGSGRKRQPSLGAGNRNLFATITALRHEQSQDMVPAMLTADELQILATSLGVAGRAVLFSLPVAIAFAWALSRPNFPGKWLIDAIAHLPLVLPPVLVGYLLLLVFGLRGPVGSWLHQAFGIQLAFTAEGAALATAVMAFPLMVRAIRLSFEATDRGLFEAAAVLRAGPWDRFWSMALPLAWPGVLAGAVTAFAAGLGEFGAVITFASNVEGKTQTLPLAIYSALQVPNGEEMALRLAAISMTAAVTGLLLAELLQRWARRRLEA